MTDNVRDKTVMITGAAAGIGREYAETMLRNGARSVAIVDLATSERGGRARRGVRRRSRCLPRVRCHDVREQLESTSERVCETFAGRLDVSHQQRQYLGRHSHAAERRSQRDRADARLVVRDRPYGPYHKGGRGGVIANVASVYGLGVENCLVPAQSTPFSASAGIWLASDGRDFREFLSLSRVR